MPAATSLDAELALLRQDVLGRLEQSAAQLQPLAFASMLDGLMCRLLQQALEETRAHEGTLWLADSQQKSLIPVFNNGPQAHRMVGRFRQPFRAGLVSMVYATEQPFLENQVQKNKRQSKKLDRLLGVQTCSLLIVPFYFVHRCRGVLSCVQLKERGSRKPDPAGFNPEDLTALRQASTLLGHLVDRRLVARLLDLPWH
jgi:hypothetical protein